MAIGEAWTEVGDGVFVHEHDELRLNTGLVVGARRALVVDTAESTMAGAALRTLVRRVTTASLVVVNTHAHFDHCFGNGAFAPAPAWAHAGCVDALAASGDARRAAAVAWLREQGRADLALAVDASRLRIPDHAVAATDEIDLGDRAAHLVHLGRGHTDHDLLVDVPAAGVCFCGDLVEEGAPPDFSDAFPLDWPATLDRLRSEITSGALVPGHGATVDGAFVESQAAELSALATLARRGHAAGAALEELVESAPWDAATNRAALTRAMRQLDS